ncbi:hypothetical protein [Paenibacillus sp. FSL K6-2862]|uniref:hypothetical protein n=1 Tax=Paenibacillus sp. FSL K6-2862 TaxID=2921484 RepID=UPI0030F9CBA5
MNWLFSNKGWLFSGVGVVALGAVLKFIYSKIKKGENDKSKNIDRIFKFEDQVYWKKSDLTKENPYCPRCLDVENKKVHLSKISPKYKNYQCPNCKTKIINESIPSIKPVVIKTNTKQFKRKDF